MRVLHFDQEKAKLRIENVFDLFYLRDIIEPKDEITAKSLRSIFVKRGEKIEKVGKKFVRLTIKVEKVRLRKNILRIIGKIVEAPEDIKKGYHSIEVKVGSTIEIKKAKWKKEKIEKLRKAEVVISFADRRIIEEFFMHVNKNDGYATYGIKPVKFAIDSNGVKILLIPEKKFGDRKIEKMIYETEKRGGKIKIVKSKNWGKKFCDLYDIGALLRFPIFYLS
jgi:stalled ribosome rescue protein Dom34